MVTRKTVMRRGPDFEILFAPWLATFVPGVERRTKAGMNDKGDISGLRDWTLELKATQSFSLTGLVEAEKEAQTAGTPWYAYVWKWRGHSVYKCIVSMYAQTFAEVLEHIHQLEEENKKLRYALKMVKGGG